ncbi:DNA-binding GntR family transcriptional regulator [Thermocatellispora tengchongensis]|uniref:DNA-binding GntR family transcriptional regulator n=1 Tax=Thermocatellispora tengchongensis TaxID=1073253 RepID=A0A840P6J6_9ACTN|nr:winged helix-turn-helix domain-containing protein [Thermocatellispora tengchongensis]MBB5134206.1 DNA-binding GntR family transcriptional regulator [Thermocatellispora tengchongensis]
MSQWLTGWRIFTQIADRLRERIALGEYPPGAVLPSEVALCREFHVARNTVRRALAVLEGEGLIVTVPAKGRVVVSGSEPSVALYRYAFIAHNLRRQIARGDLAPGDTLPSEAELRRRFQVSRNTVRHALAELERAGLIVTEHGKGRYVRGS